MGRAAPKSLTEAVAASGLIDPDSAGVLLCSGGADSAGLAAGLAGHCDPERLVALHLDYGLREDSDLDRRACAELCERLGIELVVEHPRLAGDANVQAAAREARYTAAERLLRERGCDWIATGHTRSDLAETLIYRLATSPGRRALLGLQPRRGAIVRPLLELDRETLRLLVQESALPFRDDPSNAGVDYARNRIRNEVLPVLREIGPAADATIAETREELSEESRLLERLAAEALEATGADLAGAVSLAELEQMDPALRRLALRILAERAAGWPVALGRRRTAEIERLALKPEGGTVELGAGVEARVEYGHVRFAVGPPGEPPPATTLTVPGSCRFGEWRLTAELRPGPASPLGPDAAYLDPRALAGTLTVRAWREGDRISPLGLDGSKSLQDLFTDRKVPRSLRRTLPVITSGEKIVWIAGVAVSGEFAVEPEAPSAAVLTASAT